jgi:hypothetical protein
VLKSELYELNKKQEIIKSPIFRDEGKDINNNANNNFSYSPDNYLEFEDNIKIIILIIMKLKLMKAKNFSKIPETIIQFTKIIPIITIILIIM